MTPEHIQQAADRAEARSKVLPPAAGMGRKKGVPNKTTKLLKDAILKAAEDAGDGDLVRYLAKQAIDNPGPFMALLGKVLPLQIAGDKDNPLHVISTIERRLVRPQHSDG
jgi:hypothetical protein